jgi:segregation and condensation protein B
MDHFDRYIESLIFATEHPVTAEEIAETLRSTLSVPVTEEAILKGVDRLRHKYSTGDYAFEIIHISEGFQFMTKGAFHHVVGEYLKQITRKRLSRTALETLSIIAYKQPVTKPEIEQIRGVNSDYSIQKLLEKNLIEIVGRDDGPGRPLVYGTSQKFLDYFGLRSMRDLPDLKDFDREENTIGEGEYLFEEE